MISPTRRVGLQSYVAHEYYVIRKRTGKPSGARWWLSSVSACCSGGLRLKEAFDLTQARRVAHLPQRLGFDLADAFARGAYDFSKSPTYKVGLQ
jgi:hypothetical protein